MEEEPKNSVIQKFLRSEGSFYFTLATAIAVIVGLYYGTQASITKVDTSLGLLSQKLEFYTQNFAQVSDRIAKLEEIVSTNEKEIVLLKSQVSTFLTDKFLSKSQ